MSDNLVTYKAKSGEKEITPNTPADDVATSATEMYFRIKCADNPHDSLKGRTVSLKKCYQY